MTILFIYDSPLLPEKGGTERATKLVIDEMTRRGHSCIGLLHFNQSNPDEYFLNSSKVDDLKSFLEERHVDVVVNQIAFHYWLLNAFLAHGGQEWRDKGGKIVSFMHFDPAIFFKPVSSYCRNFKDLSLWGKIKRLGLFLYLPKLRYDIAKTRRFSYRYIYEHSDRYVVMSPSYIKEFGNVSGIKNLDKTSVITNMLTFPQIVDERILQKKRKIVLVVSRLDEDQKRISVIINAWKSVKDYNGYELHIVGTGQDEEFLKGMADGVDNIFFEGHQSPLEWYRTARIFLLSSPREGWGLTITESLQNCVVPIVMNTSTVFSDIITDGETGFLAKDEKEYVSRLRQLLADDDLRNKMAIAGLKSASRFSPEAIGDEWEKMLKEIIPNNGYTTF